MVVLKPMSLFLNTHDMHLTSKERPADLEDVPGPINNGYRNDKIQCLNYHSHEIRENGVQVRTE